MPTFKILVPAALALIGTANAVVPSPVIAVPDTGDTLDIIREAPAQPSFFGGQDTVLDRLMNGARVSSGAPSARQEVAIASDDSVAAEVEGQTSRFDSAARADRGSERTRSASGTANAESVRTDSNARAARVTQERRAADDAEVRRLRYQAINSVTADEPLVTTTTAPETTNTTWRATTTTTSTTTTSTTTTNPPTTSAPATTRPPVTQAPTTQPRATQPPATQPPATQPAAAVPAGGAGGTLACIRSIESGGNYAAVNSSGKYRGAYQFDRTTWNSVASRHNPAYVGVDPAAAPPGVQDQIAAALISERGLQPWPTPNKRC